MATKLDKSIKRELEHQGKLYTITLAPDGVKVVEKGKRNGKELSWASIISGEATLNVDLKLSGDARRPSLSHATAPVHGRGDGFTGQPS